jgi:hypothetical protein
MLRWISILGGLLIMMGHHDRLLPYKLETDVLLDQPQEMVHWVFCEHAPQLVFRNLIFQPEVEKK